MGDENHPGHARLFNEKWLAFTTNPGGVPAHQVDAHCVGKGVHGVGQRGDDAGVVGERGEDHDRHVRMLTGKPARGLDAVEHRHVQVEQDRVGTGLADDLQGLLAVGGRTDHLYVGQQVEQHDESFPHARLVVGDDDSHDWPEPFSEPEP